MIAAYSDDVLPDRVPELDGCKRSGGHITIKGKEYRFVNAQGLLVGKLWVMGNNRTLELYDKDSKLHGNCRKWWKPGVLGAETPYVHGIRHGVWRNWNLEGQLVGESEFENGTGVLRVYHDNGCLKEELRFEDNVKHGIHLYLHDNRQIKEIYWMERGEMIRGIYFDRGGKIRYTHWSNAKGLHGAYFGYASELRVRVDGKPVTKAEYEAAREKDATLPPYFASIEECKTFIRNDEEVVNLLKHYRELKPVPIPLRKEAKK